jgi:HlyD family secretion protein
MTSERRRRLALQGAAVGVVALVAAAGSVAVARSRGGEDLVQGQFEATEVNVSAKVAGRVRALHATEGQAVRAGDLLVELTSPDLDAKLAQAEAAREAARAQSDKAENGAREEEVRQARSQWERATHAEALARTTFERLARLHRDGVVPAQRRDEAETQWRTAEAATAAARAAYDMAEAGARREDREAAAALEAKARGAVAEVEAFLAETRLAAPAPGEVARVNAEPGELVAPGAPIVTLVDLGDAWLTLQLREDRLFGLRVGDRLTARVPALRDREVELLVFYLAPQGDYATWRATSASGGFDLKTFEVRARPAAPVDGLRPGMTGLVAWDRR